MNQFIIIINGPIVSGKTWAVDAIMAKYKKVFRLSINKIKFLISDYNPERDRGIVHEATMIIADRMLANGMSIIMEGGSIMQGKVNEELEELGKKYRVKTTYVNVEAPLETLMTRFHDRVRLAPSRGSKLSVTDDAGFMKRYDAYQGVKGSSNITLDSSTMTPDEIAQKIMALV